MTTQQKASMSTHIRSDCLVDAAWVAANLQNPHVQLVEVDVSRSTYDAGHLDGAILWDVYGELLQPSYRLVEAPVLEDLLSRSGITPETTVVFYGYAGALGAWLLTLYRHRDVRVLNGSRMNWEADGLAMTAGVPTPARRTYRLPDPDLSIRATRETVESAIGDPTSIVLDVRSELEFTGERFWPSLPPQGHERAGHIPGAILVPIDAAWQEDGTFKSRDQLRAIYAQHGVTADANIITYCTVGGRASQAWFILTHLLGYPRVRVYDASWAEWGTLPDTPVAQ